MYILVNKSIDYIIEELNFCSHKWVVISEKVSDIILLNRFADPKDYSVITKTENKLSVQSYESWVAE